jgi:hypothetical protein
VDAGPRPFYRAALVSLAATCVLVIGICLDEKPAGRVAGPQREMIIAALAGLVIAGALGLASVLGRSRRGLPRLDALVAPDTRAAGWLALTVWFPFLILAAHYRAKATLGPSVHWIAFGFLDKRWVTALYLLGVFAPMIFLVAAARVLQAGRDHPATWRAWLRGLAPAGLAPAARPAGGPAVAHAATAQTAATPTATVLAAGPDSGQPGWVRAAWVTAGILTALALAYYFYGPPWYLTRTTTVIGGQEGVFLAGIQAISKGNVPYIGPAAIQYGPGAQLLSYLFMKHVATFSIVGFRESWALFHWAGASIFFVAVFLAFGYARGLVTSLLSALIYPALQLMAFHQHQYTGSFGWANPLRYAGAISLIILLPKVIKGAPAKRWLAAAAALGLILGAMSYIAQENLIGGVVGAVVVGLLLMLSGAAAARAAIGSLLAVAAGFLVLWIPLLAFYAANGVLGRFVYLYLLIPRAVADGYSNTPFGGPHHTPSPWTTMFYVLPFVLFVLALLAVVQFRPLRIAVGWSAERIMIVAAVITTILLYQGALFRSDNAHLTGTLLFLPALIIVIAAGLPKVLGARRRPAMVVAGVVLFAVSFALLPSASWAPSQVKTALTAPFRVRQAGEASLARPATLAAGRVGTGLANAPVGRHFSHVPMTQFTRDMNRLHAIVGNRVTYVVDAPIRYAYPGLIYFTADLTPAPIALEPWTMVMNVPQRTAFLADFTTTVLPRTQALVTTSLTAPEAVAFRQRYPGARRHQLTVGSTPYYVLLQP